MPVIQGVVETFGKLIDFHKRKNDDYSGDKGSYFNFEFAEYVSSIFKNARDKVYATMLGIKVARLSVVITKPPNFESVEDTFDDIIVYMAIWKSDYVNRIKSTKHISEVPTIRETGKS